MYYNLNCLILGWGLPQWFLCTLSTAWRGREACLPPALQQFIPSTNVTGPTAQKLSINLWQHDFLQHMPQIGLGHKVGNYIFFPHGQKGSQEFASHLFKQSFWNPKFSSRPTLFVCLFGVEVRGRQLNCC